MMSPRAPVRDPRSFTGLHVTYSSAPDEFLPWADTQGVNVYVLPIDRHVYLETFKYTAKTGGEEAIMLRKAYSSWVV